MREFERLFKALANRRRLTLVHYLKDHRQATVGELAAMLRLSFSATSRHLALLAAVDLVESEQRGLQVYYRLGAVERKLRHAISTIC